MDHPAPTTVSVLVCLLLAGGVAPARAQAPAEAPAAPIQDNSFLVEEAYNQERGVVQHISTFARPRGGGAWSYSFTQEWPLLGQRHQIGFTLPVESAEGARGGTGVGDLALNYRWQVLGIGGSRVALAPRVSALLPTGDEERGRGAGGAGVQANLPLSVVLADRWVAHSNAGVTHTFSARNALGQEAGTTGYNLGQSLIWLAHPRLNLMLEAAWSRDDEVVGADATRHGTSFFLAPGIRGAVDLPSGLQVVPGVAVPIGVGPSDGERALFLYLSFEHPFGARRD
ncbi:MAG: transporter [Longimicrobiaceae bacterium]